MNYYKEKCQFCGLHPYEYVNVGIGSVPIADNCCSLGYACRNWNTLSWQQKLLFHSETHDSKVIRRLTAGILILQGIPSRIRWHIRSWRRRCSRCGRRNPTAYRGGSDGIVCFECHQKRVT